VANLCRGRIARVEVLDPQNRNPKRRPALVITPTAEIRPDGNVTRVAITDRQKGTLLPAPFPSQ
jgi:mRNA-degrading endonuclease toxin of MazEF toxin-antitoxin module